MENPINIHEKTLSEYTTREGAQKLLQSIIEEFDNSRDDINKYLMTSKIVFDSKKLYNDTEQRKVLIPVVEKIGAIFQKTFDALETVDYEDETKYSAAVRDLYGTVLQVKELLNKAPDSRYSKTNLAEAYDGEENIPAGTASHEDTIEAIQKLQSILKGVKIGLGFSE